MHCFMLSICDAESEFNDGTSQSYHLLNHHKDLEWLKNIWAWKATAIKVKVKYKKQCKILLSLRKKKNNKSDIYQKYFQILKLSILLINHQYDVSLWKILLYMIMIYNYSLGHNILRFFDVLPIFSFTTTKTNRNY